MISFVVLCDPFWLNSTGIKTSNWSIKNQLTVIWLIVITPLISSIGFSITVPWLGPPNALIAQPPADILRTLIHHHFSLMLIKICISHCNHVAEAFVAEAGFFHCLCVNGSHRLQCMLWDHRLVNSIPGTPFRLDPLLIHSMNFHKRTTTSKSLC